MRLLVASVAALGLFAGQAKAAVVSMDTTQHPLGPTSSFDVTVTLSLFGGIISQSINIGGAVTGGGWFDLNLDGTNSGTIETINNSFSIADGSIGFIGPIVSGQAIWQNLGFEVSFLENVTNRNFGLTGTTAAGANFTPGGVNLNSGQLTLNLTTGIVTVVTLNFTSSPSLVAFSELGTNVVPAEADADGAGTNPFGPEFDLPSLAFATTFLLPPLTDIQRLSVFAQIFIGSTIPEFGSFGLLSLGFAGLGGAALYRRRRQA
jgi:hypothetical protein